MKSLTAKARNAIEGAIDNLFESMAFHLLGVNPKKGKRIYFSTEKPQETLANLYVQAMQNRQPNDIEKEAARGMMKTANKFITALKEKTSSQIVDQIDAKVREGSLGGPAVTDLVIKRVIDKEMKKAKSHFKMIAETESTKARNTGSVMDISKIGASMGIQDPSCFFIVTKDGSTCKHCLKNHLRPDGITPKVFKLSEVKQSYLSKEERDAGDVSVAGQHPHCRCSLAFLSPGFGFQGGKVSWISLGHDEYLSQKK